MPRTGVWLFPDATSVRVVEAVTWAEAVGLDEVWLGDEGPARDPFALLAAAATLTKRLRLAVGVTNPYVRHPVMTATAAATVQEVSQGRMVLGIGAGGKMSLAPLGIAPVRPLTDCRNALRLMRAALAAVPTDGYEPPAFALAAPDLPIFVGGRGERFNRWASAEADGAFVAGIAPMLVPAVVEWARSSRPIEIALYLSTCLDEDQWEASRPRMIHAFADAPPALRERAGLRVEAVQEAALALNAGDDAPARELMVDGVVDLVLLRPGVVVDTCVRLARRLRPASIGLALLGGDPVALIDRAGRVMRDVTAALA